MLRFISDKFSTKVSPPKTMSCEWGYGLNNGPDRWHETFPVAVEGQRQSPIDIDTAVSVTDANVKPLKWTYVPENIKDIENTGASWKVNVDGKGSCLTGGLLDGEYELWQFHAHWGAENERGSEHTVDGKRYSAELHLVHWNRSKYKSPSEAAGQPDGLAVLGIFIEIGDMKAPRHEEFEKICQLIPKIKYKGQKVNFEIPLDCNNFFPDNKQFWTYEGSLTTPPLNESVIWHVFKEPIQITELQLNTMRSMMCCTEKDMEGEGGILMVDNFRPPCPRNGRVLRSM